MSTPINREDIRKGDRVRRTTVFEYTVTTEQLCGSTPEGYTYELIERPVVLPTAWGTYSDKVGDIWTLDDDGLERMCDRQTRAADYAPFTLLRPVAEVAAEVLDEVQLEMSSSADYWQADLAKIRTRYATN